jgi:hypothetical protein
MITSITQANASLYLAKVAVWLASTDYTLVSNDCPTSLLAKGTHPGSVLLKIRAQATKLHRW